MFIDNRHSERMMVFLMMKIGTYTTINEIGVR